MADDTTLTPDLLGEGSAPPQTSPLQIYRKYLQETGQTDDRPDQFIIGDIGDFLHEKRPDLLQSFPDFNQQYQEVRRASYPGLGAELGRALKSGTEGLASTAVGGIGLVTDSDYLKKKAADIDKAAQENAASIPTLEDVAPEKKGIRRLLSEDALRYGLSKAGSVLPSIAESVLTAGAGAAVGSALGPEGTLAGAAEGFFERGLVRAAIRKLAAKGTEATAENIAKEAAAIGAFRGGVAANAASSFILNSGDVASEGADKGTTIALGIVAALPDTILPAYVLKKIFPGMAKEAAVEAGKTWLARNGTKLAELVGVPAEEFGQEYFQQAADVVARNVKDGKDPLSFSQDNLKELREAGIAGAAGGLFAAPGVMLSSEVKPSLRRKLAEDALNGVPPVETTVTPPASGGAEAKKTPVFDQREAAAILYDATEGAAEGRQLSLDDAELELTLLEEKLRRGRTLTAADLSGLLGGASPGSVMYLARALEENAANAVQQMRAALDLKKARSATAQLSAQPVAAAPVVENPLAAAPGPAALSPARRVAQMTPEQQTARLAELSALPTPTPDEAAELELLTATAAPPATGAPQVPPPVAPPVTAPAPPASGVSVPLMVTNEMGKRLRDLGYTIADINKMNPAEANDILNAGTAKVASVPTEAVSSPAAVLADQPVKIPGKRARTGEQIEVEMPAAKAEEMLTKRADVLKKLMDCLAAA